MIHKSPPTPSKLSNSANSGPLRSSACRVLLPSPTRLQPCPSPWKPCAAMPSRARCLRPPPCPRPSPNLTAERQSQIDAVLCFVRAHGVVHRRVADAHFAHGSSRKWFGAAMPFIVRKSAWPMPRSTAKPTIGPPLKTRPPPAMRPMRWCAFWPRLTRWCGTAAALNTCGAGPTALRPTRPHPNGCGLLRAATPVGRAGHRLGQCVDGRRANASRVGYVAGKPPSGAAFSAALDEELQRMETFLQAGASEKG